ncbi:MAG: hypothetical protein IID38_05815 [Planctomycetes bacterium]|nr:hypothetical protein [Planctomycetota bacterium]
MSEGSMNDIPDPSSSSREPGPEEDPAGASETELDDILAQAASLATGLSEELGSEEAASTSQESPAASDAAVERGEVRAADPTPEAEPQRNLEGELENLDELLATTSSELAGPARDQSGAVEANGEPAASTDKSDADGTTVPTFMDEFTQPEAPAEEAPELETLAQDDATGAEESPSKPPEEAGAVTGNPQAKPGVVGTGMLGVVSTPGASPISEVADVAAAMPESEVDIAAGSSEPDPSPKSPLLSRLLALPRVVASRLAPVNDLLCEQGSRLLDLMDRPLQHTNSLVRRLVGLVALATMAISIIVLVFSLF